MTAAETQWPCGCVKGEAGVILTHDVCTACGDADHGNLDCDSCRTWQYQEGNLDDPREDGTAV